MFRDLVRRNSEILVREEGVVATPKLAFDKKTYGTGYETATFGMG